MAMYMALSHGKRGLRPGSSLARLLEKHRGVRNRGHLPKLTHAQIVRWAIKHHENTGHWPTLLSGPIAGTKGETWHGVQAALSNGSRGFSGGSSLARVLESKLGVRNLGNLPPFSEARILAWADLHHRQTGDWPSKDSGLVRGSRGERWSAIDTALHDGLRGLPDGSSLAKLLAKHRGVNRHRRGHHLSIEAILNWAKSQYRQTGKWPHCKSGPVHGRPGETWGALQMALLKGYHGLPKGMTLSKLLTPLKEKLARSGSR